MRIIGYAYDADCHCVDCTRERADVGLLKRVPPLKLDTDEHGIALDLVDDEGNDVHPIFSTDENATDETCGDCGNKLWG